MAGGRGSRGPAAGNGAAATQKGRKGKNFVPDEERQLCVSVLHVSQDPIVGNGQCGVAFWKRIHEHYDEHRSAGFRPVRLLESKWGNIKHDVSKFIGVYQQIEGLNRSGTSGEDTLKLALELYREKSPKNTEFTYLHCWSLVKNIPRWDQGVTRTVIRKPPLKRPTPSAEQESECTEMPHSAPLPEIATSRGSASPRSAAKRPQGCCSAKDDNKFLKVREHALKAQAATNEKMAAAMMMKRRISWRSSPASIRPAHPLNRWSS